MMIIKILYEMLDVVATVGTVSKVNLIRNSLDQLAHYDLCQSLIRLKF